MLTSVAFVAAVVWALKYAKRRLDYLRVFGLIVPFFALPELIGLFTPGLLGGLLVVALQLGVACVAVYFGGSFRERAMNAVIDEA